MRWETKSGSRRILSGRETARLTLQCKALTLYHKAAAVRKPRLRRFRPNERTAGKRRGTRNYAPMKPLAILLSTAGVAVVATGCSGAGGGSQNLAVPSAPVHAAAALHTYYSPEFARAATSGLI